MSIPKEGGVKIALGRDVSIKKKGIRMQLSFPT